MEQISNPRITDPNDPRPADEEVQAVEYNEATVVFDVAKKTVESSGFQTLKSYDPNLKMSVSTLKKEMGEVRHKLQEIIENPDIFLFNEALFVYPTAAQIHATNRQKFPKTNL